MGHYYNSQAEIERVFKERFEDLIRDLYYSNASTGTTEVLLETFKEMLEDELYSLAEN